MIGTEQRLWRIMKTETDLTPHKFTRIETSTVEGVADVEYVAHPWQGWIELKTANLPRIGRAFFLHSPFTLAQCSWLLAHDAPKYHMRSWLLLGLIGSRTWKGFVLFPATMTTHLLHVRKSPAHDWLLNRKGVKLCTKMHEVVQLLSDH